jgi:hypothetical protein
MTSFRKFLEGVAFHASSDMEAYAKEATEALFNGETHFERAVSADKYGTRTVKVVVTPRPEGDQGAANADSANGLITVYDTFNQYDSDAIEELMVHELIHIFDPKITNRQLRKTHWGIGNGKAQLTGSSDPEKEKKYLANPWEQDAFMRAGAISSLTHLKNMFGGNKDDIKKVIGGMRPSTQSGVIGTYSKNPKTWRRYQRTVYDQFTKNFK